MLFLQEKIDNIEQKENDFLLDDIRKRDSVEKLKASGLEFSVLRIICREEAWPLDFIGMGRFAAREVIRKIKELSDFESWLLITQNAWQPNTRLIHYHKIWKNLEKEYGKLFKSKIEDVLISRQEGILYVGMCQLQPEELGSGLNLLRPPYTGVVILDSTKSYNQRWATEEGVRLVFNQIFPEHSGLPSLKIDKANLALELCPLGLMLILPSGSIEERQYSFEIFGLKTVINTLFK